MIKRILVNRHHINHNVRHPDQPELPVISLKVGGKSHYGYRVEIGGMSEMVYNPRKPLGCGATVWIETFAPVKLYQMNDDIGEKFD